MQYRYATGPLQLGGRRFAWQSQSMGGNKVRMLQGEPAAEGGVAGDIGKDQPSRTRRKGPEAFRTAFLELLVRLEEIMEAEHEGIVERALWPARSEKSEHVPPDLAGPAASLAGGQT